MKRVLFRAGVVASLLLTTGYVLAQNAGQSAVDKWNAAIEKAATVSGISKDRGTPRVVPRGARPEVVLNGDRVTFNGKPLRLGEAIETWDDVLPGQRRCETGPNPASCVWDEIGLQAVLDFRNQGKVKAFYVFLRLPETMMDTAFEPHKPFPGYLELDGFGIDARTAFWEVRKSTDPKRNIRCGLRDCAMPKGAFGKGVGIYFDLSTPDEMGTVSVLQLDTYQL